ncbi:cilia- and flagella-associated protein 157 isoform X2 [Atheta coriaria]
MNSNRVPNARGRRSTSTESRCSIPVLKRSSSALSTTPRISRQLIRGKSGLTTPLGSVGRLSKLSTPLARVVCKSPQRLKLQFTNVNEKEYVPRIEAFIAEQGAEFEVQKPMKLNDFIGITQLYFNVLCKCSPELTLKNYKVEMPKIMKTLNYPITINQSFLKTPNTPQHFQNVISIWAFLMDWVDVITEEPEPLDMISSMAFDYVKKTMDDNGPQVCVELIESMYSSYGLTEQDYDNRMEQIANEKKALLAQKAMISKDIETAQTALECKRQKRNQLTQKHAETVEKINEVNKAIKTSDEQHIYNKKRLERMQTDKQISISKLEVIKEKNNLIGHTPEEVEALDREIERRSHYLQLLQNRNKEYQMQCRAVQDQNTQVEMQAMDLIFAFNNKIAMSNLPESQKRSLRLNEDEIKPVQISQVMKQVVYLKEQGARTNEEYRVVLNDETNKLLACETELAEETLAAEDAKKKHAERAMMLNETKAEIAATMKMIDEEQGKIKQLNDLYKVTNEKYKLTVEAVKAHKATTEETMAKMKNYTNRMLALVKEKVDGAAVKDREMEEAIQALYKEARQKIEHAMLKLSE